MKEVVFFRFSIFGTWVVTLIVTISVYLYRLLAGASIAHIDSSISSVMGVLLPQIGVMVAFFFASDRVEQRKLLISERRLSTFAIILSLVYHSAFCILVVVLIGTQAIEADINEKTSILLKMIGFFSALGLPPVAFLFAKSHASAREERPDIPTDRGARGPSRRR